MSEKSKHCSQRNRAGWLCLRRTLHPSGLCPQHRPGRDSLGRPVNGEIPATNHESEG